jgi:ribosomal protein L37AE/L43A
MKAKSYEKRIERKQTNTKDCPDCYERPKNSEAEDLWQFVKTSLKLI